MADFNVRSDSVNVEHIMEQIRSRIRDRRGVDYTEEQLRELAAVKLQKILDPQSVRSDLLDEIRRMKPVSDAPEPAQDAVDDSVLFQTHRPWLRALRRLLRPVLKLFLNTNALAVLSVRAQAEVARRGRDRLTFEVLHNLVVEITRLGIEVKNLKMRLESLSSRLEFDERRARALESAVAYQPSSGEPAAPAQGPSSSSAPPSTENARAGSAPDRPGPTGAASGVPAEGHSARRRRRRRRGRRGGGAAPPGPVGSRPDDAPGSGSPRATVPGGPAEQQARGTDANRPNDQPRGTEAGSDTDPQ